MTALTAPPHDDSEGERRPSLGEARRISKNLRMSYRNGYVVQPDINNLSIWRVGKDVGSEIRWLDQHGTREWAVEEVQRRSASRPTPPPTVDDDDEDHTADVLNTLICDIDDGKFDLTNPDDLDDLECQIVSALSVPELAEMAESLLLDLDHYHLTLDDVRQRVDDMLAVLLQAEMTEEEIERWLEEKLVGTG